MRAALSAASSLAGRQHCHKVVSLIFFDAAIGCIQATCELLAGPLDVILADIEREDIRIQRAARAKESVALTLAEERSRHEAATLLVVANEHRRPEAAA